mmetsp:Transcript_25679/g.51431  ORF Transcript_25679/g.51431 Transcript_25679/m.51431 type:complete len:162 (+) Transcript_25679:28-513(+)
MKREKVFAITKGFRGRAKNCFRIAHRAAEKALEHEYRDRKNRKREMRTMWIERLNAGAREHGLKYCDFIHGMKLANIELDRKVLADICVTEPPAFQLVCQMSREALLAKYAPNGVQERQPVEEEVVVPRVTKVDISTGTSTVMDIDDLPPAVREKVEKHGK